MNILLIRPPEIVVMFLLLITLYITAIALSFKNRSGISPYLALVFLPIIGPLGIILGNFLKKVKQQRTNCKKAL